MDHDGQTVAQMLITLVAIWLGAIFGTRRVLMEAAAAFAVISLLEPFSPNLQTLLVFQVLGGLATGFFIPLTLSFVLRNTPPRVWAYGIAIYALNLEVSLNISASLEGWYTDHLSWRWIFWQNIPFAAGMVACLFYGIRPEQPNPVRPRADVFGFIYGGLGLATDLCRPGPGQPAGLAQLAAHRRPVVRRAHIADCVRRTRVVLSVRRHRPEGRAGAAIAALLVLVSFLRLTILSTAYVIPQFLQTVRGFRALEVGETLVWIAAPQL